MFHERTHAPPPLPSYAYPKPFFHSQHVRQAYKNVKKVTTTLRSTCSLIAAHSKITRG